MEEKLLQEIGLTEGETKVYFALVKLGSTKTGPLAKEAQVSSSKVYKIIDRLEKKGLVGHVLKGDVKHFNAMNPKRILNYIEEKEEELEKKKQKVEKMIPEIQGLLQDSDKKSEAFVFEGFKGITNFFKEILDDLKSGEEYYVIGGTYGAILGLREFFYNYHNQRAKKNIRVKMLANHNEKGVLEKTTHKKAEIRFLPEYFVSNMQITFYKNKAFIHIVNKSPVGFLIENEDAVKSFKSYFNALWKIAGM